MNSDEVVIIFYQVRLIEDDCLIGQTEISLIKVRDLSFLIEYLFYHCKQNYDS